MDTSEVFAEKQLLEKKVFELIQDFCRRTGLVVDDIQLIHKQPIEAKHRTVFSVRIGVTLE